MITKIKTGCFADGSRRNPIYPLDYFGEDNEMINDKQRRRLTDLICQNIEDEEERDRLLSETSEMTSAEAKEAIFEYLRW